MTSVLSDRISILDTEMTNGRRPDRHATIPRMATRDTNHRYRSQRQQRDCAPRSVRPALRASRLPPGSRPPSNSVTNAAPAKITAERCRWA